MMLLKTFETGRPSCWATHPLSVRPPSMAAMFCRLPRFQLEAGSELARLPVPVVELLEASR